MDRLEVIGVIVGTAVAVLVGYIEVLRRSFARGSNGQAVATPVSDKALKCLDNLALEISEMRKVLQTNTTEMVEGHRVVHTNTRVMDNLRQEITLFRVELAEIKGKIQ